MRDWDFSADLRYWEYEKADFSMRLDVTTGTLEQILLEAALAGMGGSYAGANAQSGANVRAPMSAAPISAAPTSAAPMFSAERTPGAQSRRRLRLTARARLA